MNSNDLVEIGSILTWKYLLPVNDITHKKKYIRYVDWFLLVFL